MNWLKVDHEAPHPGVAWHTLEPSEYAGQAAEPANADLTAGLPGLWAYLVVQHRKFVAAQPDCNPARVGFRLPGEQFDRLLEDPALPEGNEWLPGYGVAIYVAGGIPLTCARGSSGDFDWFPIYTWAADRWIADQARLRATHAALDALDDAAAAVRAAREAAQEAEGDRLMRAVRAVSRGA